MREIREYIRAELRKLDTSLAEHESEMKFDQLPATKINNLYRIKFSGFSTEKESTNHFEDEGPVELLLYKKLDKRNPGTYDRAIDIAKKVRASLVHPRAYASTVISKITPVGFGVSEYEGNHDIYEIKINLTFTVSNSL